MMPTSITEHLFPEKVPSINGYNKGCRCHECRRLKTEWQSAYVKKRYLTRGTITVDAAPVRNHLLWLKDNGVGPKRVAELVGLSLSSMHIYRILSGKTKRVHRSTADAILQLNRTAIANTAIIDSSLTWRRLRGLMALGWSSGFLSDALGYNPNRRSLPIPKTRTTAANARAVIELVHKFGNRRGPSDGARRNAARMGWKPIGEWDDDLTELTDYVSQICPECDRAFAPSKHGRPPTYCSDACRNAARHAQEREMRSA